MKKLIIKDICPFCKGRVYHDYNLRFFIGCPMCKNTGLYIEEIEIMDYMEIKNEKNHVSHS